MQGIREQDGSDLQKLSKDRKPEYVESNRTGMSQVFWRDSCLNAWFRRKRQRRDASLRNPEP
jgi:hypothetical protein